MYQECFILPSTLTIFVAYYTTPMEKIQKDCPATHRRSIPDNHLLTEAARLVSEGHTVTLFVRGHSMNPFLHDRRDRVLLTPFSADALRRGRVVLAQCPDGRVVLHRILTRHGDQLTLMGDGNSAGTETCHLAGVMALVTTVVRGKKHYPCSGRTWHVYSTLWMNLRPLRRYLLAVYRRLWCPSLY